MMKDFLLAVICSSFFLRGSPTCSALIGEVGLSYELTLSLPIRTGSSGVAAQFPLLGPASFGLWLGLSMSRKLIMSRCTMITFRL
jgi:hypothetical protein